MTKIVLTIQALVLATCFAAGCSAAQRRTEQTVVDVALAGAQASCVRIHNEDADAGPVIAQFCRDESGIQATSDQGFVVAAQVADGGVLAINPANAAGLITSIELTGKPPADSGGQ